MQGTPKTGKLLLFYLYFKAKRKEFLWKLYSKIIFEFIFKAREAENLVAYFNMNYIFNYT